MAMSNRFIQDYGPVHARYRNPDKKKWYQFWHDWQITFQLRENKWLKAELMLKEIQLHVAENRLKNLQVTVNEYANDVANRNRELSQKVVTR